MVWPLLLREEHGGHGTRPGRGGMYVQGLSEFCVKGVKEAMHLLHAAERNRRNRETNMNEFSSRSHSIFQVQVAPCSPSFKMLPPVIIHIPIRQIFVEQKRVAPDGGEVLLRSKFSLVDLAG
jgi:Kinesin motor domain